MQLFCIRHAGRVAPRRLRQAHLGSLHLYNNSPPRVDDLKPNGGKYYFSTTTDGHLQSVYSALVEKEGYQKDPIQLRTLEYLEQLRQELKVVKPPTELIVPAIQEKISKESPSSSWSSWFGTSCLRTYRSSQRSITVNQNNFSINIPDKIVSGQLQIVVYCNPN